MVRIPLLVRGKSEVGSRGDRKFAYPNDTNARTDIGHMQTLERGGDSAHTKQGQVAENCSKGVTGYIDTTFSYAHENKAFLPDTPGKLMLTTTSPSTTFSSGTSLQRNDQASTKAKTRIVSKLGKHRPFFTYGISATQLLVYIVTLVINFQVTGEFIQTTPQFNPMIGASPGALIFAGAMYVPCMKFYPTINPNEPFICPEPLLPRNPEKNVALHPDYNLQPGQHLCVFSDLCGFSGVPDQWYRFFIPIVLHAGLVHLAFNLLFQLVTMRSLESDWGPWRVAGIYFTSGLVGFIFGGNLLSQPTLGASGSIFGILGALILDLSQNWRYIRSPKRYLFNILAAAIFSFLLGLTPWMDNFAHIGGFLTGLVTTVVLMPTYFTSLKSIIPNRVVRTYGIKFLAFTTLATSVGLLLNSFYRDGDFCGWCSYLNCIPVLGMVCTVVGNRS